MNYTKKEIDNLLSLNSSWSLEKKQKTIRRLFKKFNAQTDTANTQNQIDHAEKMMDVCAQAIEIYKPESHKRKYTKVVKKKRKPRKKKAVKKSDDGGCLVPIVMLLSSASLFIFCILYFF